MEWLRKHCFQLVICSIGMPSICYHVQAQNWPKIYGDNFNATIAKIEESYDHGFLLSAYTYTGAGWPLNDWVIKIDINGNVLWDKNLGNEIYSNGVSDSKITLDHGIILAAGTSKYSGNYDPTFIKLNVCGEIEWCKVLLSPDDNYGKGILQLPDGSYIGMLQYYGEGETYARISLIKMDQTGEPIWIKRQAQDDTLIYNEEGGYLYLMSDSNFLVSGECFHPGLKPYWIKTDSSGIQMWDLMWQGGIGAAYQVTESSAGYFYCAGGFAGPGHPLTPSIFKFDMDGNPLYMAYIFGDTIVGGGADPIVIMNDSILVLGMNWRTSTNVDEGYSEIMKTDTFGNILNRRILLNENRPPKTIILTEDGKMLVCGNYVVDNNWDIYLWKMNVDMEDDTLYTQPLTYDSLCPYEIQSDTVDLDCGVFVNINELPTKEEYESAIKISPNPSHDWITLTLPDVAAKGAVEMVVYDIYGREVGKLGSGGVMPVNRMILMDISACSPGMYIAVIKDRKGRRYTGKFVVI